MEKYPRIPRRSSAAGSAAAQQFRHGRFHSANKLAGKEAPQGFEHLSRASFAQPRADSEPETSRTKKRCLVNEAINVLASQEFSPPVVLREEMLALDAGERVAAFRSGGKVYRHVFRRIS